MRVRIPSVLHSYTGGVSEVVVVVPDSGGPPTVGTALAALDARYPGLRFRIVDEQRRLRPHVQLFVGRNVQRDLAAPIRDGAELMIVAALSGG